jgi:SAM-dependent methyltransferase
MSGQDLKSVNVNFVHAIKARMPHDQAMEAAVGGHFRVMGDLQLALLRRYGLRSDDYLIDVGCGSGRLAKPLSAFLRGPYLGIDLVPALVAHAQRIVGRPDWRFQVIKDLGIPERDGRADMVCFFSVLTHLLHEQSYRYLEEARRVLKPGGAIVFSFLEFREAEHLNVFRQTVEGSKRGRREPLNVFMDRDAIHAWARDLDLTVEDIRAGHEAVAPEGALGQSLCVLRKA